MSFLFVYLKMALKHGHLEKWTKKMQKMYGPVKDDITGEWRRRKNIELENIEPLYNGSIILEVIKRGR